MRRNYQRKLSASIFHHTKNVRIKGMQKGEVKRNIEKEK